MIPVKLALSSKAGCGKSTIAERLVKSYGFIELSFAEKLKQICLNLFPELMTGDSNKNNSRWILQKFGTDCREIDQFVWIKPVLQQLDNEYKNVPRIVVSDLRYLNEYLVLKSRGFKLVRIERPRETRKKYGYNVDDMHGSETELDYIHNDGWDLVVDNRFEYPFTEALDFIIDAFRLDE